MADQQPADPADELVLAALAASRHIPSGEVRSGCTVSNGDRLRARLRAAVQAARSEILRLRELTLVIGKIAEGEVDLSWQAKTDGRERVLRDLAVLAYEHKLVPSVGDMDPTGTIRAALEGAAQLRAALGDTGTEADR